MEKVVVGGVFLKQVLKLRHRRLLFRPAYLGGTVHAMAGATIRHNNIAGNCFASLHSSLRDKTCQPLNSDTKVRIEFPDHTHFYYPDAMVVCQSNPDTDHFQNLPVVIIEVLSDSTRHTDLGEKRDAYRTISSSKALIFVDSDSPTVTHHRRMGEGGFEIERYNGLDTSISLPEIEASLKLADLYDRVDFPSAVDSPR
jgi:Uma2 family endonuclease